MQACKQCGNSNHSTIIIHTETTFGHGDSTHICYVECECGNRSAQESNWGIFEMGTFRKAQSNWNEENK
jgi:hypothetical protein